MFKMMFPVCNFYIFLLLFMCFTLTRYADGLKHMLDDYHNVVGTLNEAETKLLDDHIQELWKVFKVGQRRLNWNSLGNGEPI